MALHPSPLSDSTVEQMLAFIAEFVRNGCHHACTESSCSFAGQQRRSTAKGILAQAKAELERAEKQLND